MAQRSRWRIAPLPTPGPIERWEWALLGVLVFGCLVYWVAHFRPFVIPKMDFGTFELVAKSLWAGELPGSFKRMPLFPLAFGGLAQLLPGEWPHLYAALLLNIPLSLGILVLVFLLGRPLIGPAAFLPTIAIAMIGELHVMALQPLVDPALTFFVLLGLTLFVRESRWQYLAAGLAALCRYEHRP